MWPMGGFGAFGGSGIFGLAGLIIGIVALVKVQNLKREFDILKDELNELKGKNKTA
jgi:predicted PurR-regulated permease PerM